MLDTVGHFEPIAAAEYLIKNGVAVTYVPNRGNSVVTLISQARWIGERHLRWSRFFSRVTLVVFFIQRPWAFS